MVLFLFKTTIIHVIKHNSYFWCCRLLNQFLLPVGSCFFFNINLVFLFYYQCSSFKLCFMQKYLYKVLDFPNEFDLLCYLSCFHYSPKVVASLKKNYSGRKCLSRMNLPQNFQYLKWWNSTSEKYFQWLVTLRSSIAVVCQNCGPLWALFGDCCGTCAWNERC